MAIANEMKQSEYTSFRLPRCARNDILLNAYNKILFNKYNDILANVYNITLISY